MYMHSLQRSALVLAFGGVVSLVGCGDDPNESVSNGEAGTATDSGTGDGDGNETGSASQGDGDGDGDAGDGDGDGDGDAGDGDGDGDAGDGDGDGDAGDGDGDGDAGDGDGDGDGDGGGDGDGDGDEGLCADGCGTPDCGVCPDAPPPIDVGMYSIDVTEVSNEQYAAFLAVPFENLSGLMPPSCGWKLDFTPDDWPDDDPTLPVRYVDWCDASTYCAWAGKRLCGAVGGGMAPLDSNQNPVTNEWYRACTQAGIKNYPYGVPYDGLACNTADSANGQRLPVGSLLTCEGGYPGVFDMSGNVWEWANSCDDNPMVPDNEQECRQHGGSYFSDSMTARCGIDSVRQRDYRNLNLGIRCCAEG
jgi:sulfatase modifying factor 1